MTYMLRMRSFCPNCENESSYMGTVSWNSSDKQKYPDHYVEQCSCGAIYDKQQDSFSDWMLTTDEIFNGIDSRRNLSSENISNILKDKLEPNNNEHHN